jgi:hypothetical protein
VPHHVSGRSPRPRPVRLWRIGARPSFAVASVTGPPSPFGQWEEHAITRDPPLVSGWRATGSL